MIAMDIAITIALIILSITNAQFVAPPPPFGPLKRHVDQLNCTTPQMKTVHDCYVTYLEKYGIHSDQHYLPEYDLLDAQLKNIPLASICRNFDELMACVRLVSYDCISVPVFEKFIKQLGKGDAFAYIENHAFFEYACGPGKSRFLANNDCLSSAFNNQTLKHRIRACLPDEPDKCTRAIRAVECLKDSLSTLCSVEAGAAACGAATNVAKRFQEVNSTCIQEMNMRCSSSFMIAWFSSVLALFYLYLF